MNDFTIIDYDDFETDVTSRGFKFNKVITQKMPEDKVAKTYYFTRQTIGRYESIGYRLTTIYWRPNFKEISVDYTTNDVAVYNSFKTDLKINSFKKTKSQDYDNGLSVLTFYENPEFGISVATTVGRAANTNHPSFLMQVFQLPLLKIAPAPR
ncbi:hypothetical protein [Dyadobacter sp. OTU695]|uniref:hypothetical protein n=1 Tax=Dyadobacter sp. OTU695 TaxID=3043860 RepID=UPI00313AAB49